MRARTGSPSIGAGQHAHEHGDSLGAFLPVALARLVLGVPRKHEFRLVQLGERAERGGERRVRVGEGEEGREGRQGRGPRSWGRIGREDVRKEREESRPCVEISRSTVCARGAATRNARRVGMVERIAERKYTSSQLEPVR